jgi:hypothetical protein
MVHVRSSLALLSLALAPPLLACGGTSGNRVGAGANCGTVQPCGGDVVGNWTIVDSCQLGIHFDFDFCADETVDATGLATTGTFSMNADLSYGVSTRAGGSFQVQFPASCVTGGSCAELASTVASALVPMLGTGLQGVSCAGAGACVCTAVVVSSTNDEAGTYAVMGTFFNAMPAGDTTFVAHDYCVEGDTMHLVSLDPGGATGPDGRPAIIYDVVSRRR